MLLAFEEFFSNLVNGCPVVVIAGSGRILCDASLVDQLRHVASKGSVLFDVVGFCLV